MKTGNFGKYVDFMDRHFAVTNGFMASVSYPQMAQGLQLQQSEVVSLHDQNLINPLTATPNRSSTSLTHFYHGISKQPMPINENTPNHNHNHSQFNPNDSLSIRSLSNTIEII